ADLDERKAETVDVDPNIGRDPRPSSEHGPSLEVISDGEMGAVETERLVRGDVFVFVNDREMSDVDAVLGSFLRMTRKARKAVGPNRRPSVVVRFRKVEPRRTAFGIAPCEDGPVRFAYRPGPR